MDRFKFLLTRQNLVFLGILVILFSLLATLSVIRQQQELRGRAIGEASTLTFTGPNVQAGNPPTATNQIVNLRLTWNSSSGTNPTSTPIPTSSGATATPIPTTGAPLSLTASPASVASGGTITVSWTGVVPTSTSDVFWFISTSSTSWNVSKYLVGCADVTAAVLPTTPPPPAGSCTFTVPTAQFPPSVQFSLAHVVPGGALEVVKVSNTVTIQ